MHTPNKLKYILYALRKNPMEIFRLFQVAFTTFMFLYIRQCVGKGTTVEPGTKIINAGNVHIGRDCLLKEGNYIRSGGAKGAQGTIIIKDRAALNAFCKIFGHGSVTIGEDTQLGPGTLVTTTSHDYSDDGDLKTFYVPVEIGNRVWIGANVTILPGVKIGDHAVIGAGSVVTRDIPPRSVAVGVPARVIKSIDDGMQKILPNQSENHRAEMKSAVAEGK